MSFIPVSPENHFPVQNLPYGVFSTSDNVSKLTYLYIIIPINVMPEWGGGDHGLIRIENGVKPHNPWDKMLNSKFPTLGKVLSSRLAIA